MLKVPLKIILVSLSVISVNAYAEDSISTQVDNIIQRQQQYQNFREREDNKNLNLFLEADKIEKADLDAEKDSPCVKIDQVDLLGTSVLQDQAESIIQEILLHKCVNGAMLQNALADISNLYIEKGYITSRAYVEPQDTNTGRLVINVIEGKLDEIRFEEPQRLGRRKINMAIPRRADELLNLRDIEQGLEQMNRLRSNEVSMDVTPSKKEGYSDLVLKNNTDNSPWGVTFSIDNHGDESRGEVQRSFGLSFDDTLGLNDNLNLNIKRSRVQTAENGDANIYINYSIPYGHWTFDAGFNEYDHKTRVNTLLTSFMTYGENKASHIQAKRMLERTQRTKLQVFGKLTHNEVSNYLEDVLIGVSSYKLANLSIGAEHTKLLERGQLNTTLKLTQGLTMLGADDDDNREYDDEPEAQFTKLNLSMDLSKGYSVDTYPVNHRVNLEMQYSDNILYPIERFAVGGQYSVRGFENYSESSNSGWYIRNELSTHKKIDLEKIEINIQPYVGFDVGRVRQSFSGEVLKGGSIGFRVYHKNFYSDLGVHKAIDVPDGVDNSGFLLGRVNFNF